MNPFRLLAPFALLIQLCAGAEAPPAKALKYHEALLKRPSNATLFDRFFGAWIDEQDMEALEAFLIARAAENGGADLSVLARYQLRRGNEEAALETLGKAISALPQDFTLPMERAKILLRSLEFENARKDLEVVSAGTDAALALESSKLIGKSWLREGNPEQAIKAWDKLLAANPGDEDLLEDLVESAAAEGESEHALKYIDKLIAAGPDPYKKTLRQLRRGDLLAQAGRHDDAVAAYSATLAEVGEGSWLEREVLAQIDKAFRKQDRIGELKDKLAELAEANPRRLLIHRELARIEAAQGETDAAVGRFREVLKRTPGNRELREEFVRLLTDGEKYEEATTELQKLIEIAPEDSALLLQMADLRHREGNKETTLAALEKARALLGAEDESAGVRIAGLMFQYGLGEAGEKLLLKLTANANASEAPSEALAAEYARTNRKPEALAILEKIAASENLETVLRAAGTISALSESDTALKVLTAKEQTFKNEPRFLAAISQAALAAGKPEIAVTHSVKLVRLAAAGTDLADSIVLALRAIADAEKTDEWRTTLEKQATRTPAETCLLASLADSQSDFDAVSKIMEGAKDPALIRFHAALLDRRSEFEQAITVLKSLADTDEGRKASYFKDMADLQRRAGLTDEALATVELWKQSAPGDKTAWVTGSSILREEGRAEEAVKATRQAVARFDEDNDLAATLAGLHEEAGQTEDAEAIYWRLYDESESPSDQARWSVRLAELSMSTGRTEELEEKLRERARGNRRSIGPILAQAELARITRDEDKRRDLLLEAVRLQPKDIDLRLQIANLEEQGGNPERVIAILEEAVPADTTNRVRSALAQAYLRQGQTLKGMRELRALAGKQADDPRAIEQSAASLAGSGLYEEAIRFLREALPDGGDWRTKYLLAVMLEHDGRETEAIPLFQALRQASGDLKSTIAPPANQNQRGNPWDEYPESVREIIRIMTASQAAYAHRNLNNQYGGYLQGGMRVGPFMLPDDAETVRTYSLVHLTKLGALDGEDNAFTKELVSLEPGSQPDFATMLSKYPEQPGLLEIILLYAGWNESIASIDPDLLRNLLEKRKDLSPEDLLRAHLTLATVPNAPESAWQDVVKSCKAMVAESKPEKLTMVCYQMLGVLTKDGFKIPDAAKKDLTEMLLTIASSEKFDAGPLEGFHLVIYGAVGTTAQWIKAANKEIESFRSEATKGNHPTTGAANTYAMAGRSGMSRWMMGGETPFSLPTLDGIDYTSLPEGLLQMIRPSDEGDYYGTKAMNPELLLGEIGSFTSPTLRTWIAMRAANAAAIEKELASTPPAIESADYDALRAIHAINKKDFPTAYRFLSGRRAALASDRNAITSLNFQLLAIAAEMTPDQRKEITEELGQLIIQSRRTLGTQGAPLLAAQAQALGLDELAKRFTTPASRQMPGGGGMGTASFGTNNNKRSSSGNATIERLKKFASDGKNEAAALEALNLIRKAYQNQSNRGYVSRQIREAVSPEVLAELMKLIEPGDSKSLTKLTEYADICLDFGKRDQALTVLNRIHTERPNDARIAAKLAFSLPPAQSAKATALFKANAAKDGFAETAHYIADTISDDSSDEKAFALFATIASFLETAAPEDLMKANLTWIAYHARSFHDGDFSSEFPGLDDMDPAQYKNRKDFALYIATAKRIALAMLSHDSTAEEGFRLLRNSRAWKLPDAETDKHARTALMAGAKQKDDSDRTRSFFEFRSSNGRNSSGDDLAELSSVGWLTARLGTAKSPDEILPPAYLAKLREKNAEFGDLTAALASIKDVAELEKLWKSDALAKASGPFAQMLREGVLTRAGSVPGAGGFFLKLLREIKPGSLGNENSRSGAPNLNLVVGALKASAAGDAKDLPAVCSAISKGIFGEKIDLSNDATGMATYQAMNQIESVFSSTKLDPLSAIRIQNAFFRLGVPVGDSEYNLCQPFREARASNVAEAEKILASFGWLDPVEKWQPFAAILSEAGETGGKITFTRTETFLVPEALEYMNSNYSDSALVAHLEKRKPQTFGALITAASLSEGADRSRLTALAFSTDAAKFASMPPERIAEFSLLLPWLPKEALANLPPAFRKKAEGANADRLAKLMERADAFMKGVQGNNNPFGSDPFDQVEDLIGEMATLDLPKATALFLEAERRFTASLSRGGRLSSYTSDGFQITERDETFEDLITDTDEPLGEPALALAFHKAIASSPEASRMSFSTNSTNTPVLFKIGYKIFTAAAKGSNPKEQQWMRAIREIQNLPEELRTDGYLAIGTYLTGRYAVQVLRNHYKPEEVKALPEQARVIHTIAVGVRNWKTDKPEDKKATSNALIAVVTDPKIAFPTRFQFISIAVTLGPFILEDPAIAETYAAMFEEYAKGERSVINSVGIHSAIVVRLAPDPDAIKPILARLNKAFWDNANTPKPGGHPAIPPNFGDELLVSAAIVGDEPTTKKLLTIAKPVLEGNVSAIYSLIASGNHALAKDLLAQPRRFYTTTDNMPLYGKKIEQRLGEFRKIPGLDPVALLRIEAMFIASCPGATDAQKPLESDVQREQRIIATYLANPPADPMLRTEIVARLIRDSHTAAIGLRDEIFAIRKTLDLKKALTDWYMGIGSPTDPAPRYLVAPTEAVIFRQAAFLQLLDGDASGLVDLAKVMEEQQAASDYHDNGSREHVREYHSRVCTSAMLWIPEAIHLGKTDGFKGAYEAFAKLTLLAEKRPEFGYWDLSRAVTMAEFLAYWNGEPAKFEELRNQIKRHASQHAYLKERWGLVQFVKIGKEHRKWNHGSFAQTRYDFLVKAFSRKEMNTFYGTNPKALQNTIAAGDLREDIMKIAANPPKGTVPTMLALLLEHYSNAEFGAKRFDSGVTAALAAINACPNDKAWNDTRFRIRASLLDKLIATKNLDKAQEVYDGFVVADLNQGQQKRHKEIGEKLAKARQ